MLRNKFEKESSMEFNELVESFAASLGVDGVEIEGGATAEEVLLDAIHGGTGGFMRV